MSDVAVIACGALSLHVEQIARRRGWQIDVHPLPPALHNRPEKIAPAVADLADRLAADYRQVAVAYADCGTYGALDQVLAERGIARLAGDHCYDVFGRRQVAEAAAAEPGTYFLTDFLARSFDRTVWSGLGIDRHPELRDEYFRNYTRVVWLAQRRRRSWRPPRRRPRPVCGCRSRYARLARRARTGAGADDRRGVCESGLKSWWSVLESWARGSPTTSPGRGSETSWSSIRARWSTPAGRAITRPAWCFTPTPAVPWGMLAKGSTDLYREIHSPEEPMWLEVGGIELATTPERLAECHRRQAYLAAIGIEASGVVAGRRGRARAAGRSRRHPRRPPRRP